MKESICCHPMKRESLLLRLCVLSLLTILSVPTTGVYADVFEEPMKWSRYFSNDIGWRNDLHIRTVADVNGDGKADAIGFGDKGVWVALAYHDRFLLPRLSLRHFGYDQGWSVTKHPRAMADVNGDGRADIVGFWYDGVRVSLARRFGDFSSPQRWSADFGHHNGWRFGEHPRIMADVNADGRSDVVGMGVHGVWVALSRGDTFGDPSLWVQDFGYNQGWRNERHPRIMADVNGDGRSDVVGFKDDGVWISLAKNAEGFTTPARWSTSFGYGDGWRVDEHPRMLADVNGDGKSDLVGFGHHAVWLELVNDQGTGLLPAQAWVSGIYCAAGGWIMNMHPRMVADVTGDGFADIVGLENTGTWVSATSIQGSAVSVTGVDLELNDFGYDQGWRTEMHRRILADVNGDEILDLVGFGEDGIWVALATGTPALPPARLPEVVYLDEEEKEFSSMNYGKTFDDGFPPYAFGDSTVSESKSSGGLRTAAWGFTYVVIPMGGTAEAWVKMGRRFLVAKGSDDVERKTGCAIEIDVEWSGEGGTALGASAEAILKLVLEDVTDNSVNEVEIEKYTFGAGWDNRSWSERATVRLEPLVLKHGHEYRAYVLLEGTASAFAAGDALLESYASLHSLLVEVFD